MGNRDQTRHVREERKEYDVRRRAARRRRCGEKSNAALESLGTLATKLGTADRGRGPEIERRGGNEVTSLQKNSARAYTRTKVHRDSG